MTLNAWSIITGFFQIAGMFALLWLIFLSLGLVFLAVIGQGYHRAIAWGRRSDIALYGLPVIAGLMNETVTHLPTGSSTLLTLIPVLILAPLHAFAYRIYRSGK